MRPLLSRVLSYQFSTSTSEAPCPMAVLTVKSHFRRGHFSRALEEAIQTHSSQWPRAWEGKNPLRAGGPGDFHSMTPTERVRTLTGTMNTITLTLSSSSSLELLFSGHCHPLKQYKQLSRNPTNSNVTKMTSISLFLSSHGVVMEISGSSGSLKGKMIRISDYTGRATLL